MHVIVFAAMIRAVFLQITFFAVLILNTCTLIEIHCLVYVFCVVLISRVLIWLICYIVVQWVISMAFHWWYWSRHWLCFWFAGGVSRLCCHLLLLLYWCFPLGNFWECHCMCTWIIVGFSVDVTSITGVVLLLVSIFKNQSKKDLNNIPWHICHMY